jgi:hypothetical protein
VGTTPTQVLFEGHRELRLAEVIARLADALKEAREKGKHGGGRQRAPASQPSTSQGQSAGE